MDNDQLPTTVDAAERSSVPDARLLEEDAALAAILRQVLRAKTGVGLCDEHAARIIDRVRKGVAAATDDAGHRDAEIGRGGRISSPFDQTRRCCRSATM